jgi:large repetitive protein
MNSLIKPNAIANRLVAVLVVSSVMWGCGHKKSDPIVLVTTPSVPLNLAVNVGTTDSSLGWDAPANNGGAAIQTYDIEATPPIAPVNVIVTGTRALLRNLSGSTYQVSVRARNSAGAGPATAAISFTPQSVSTASYQAVTIVGDTSPSGVFDPSVLRLANGDLWMAYSSVAYYNNASNQLVQDVGIRLARSSNGGATFNYAVTIATPGIATVTDTDSALSACGTTMCTGRWVYETSW